MPMDSVPAMTNPTPPTPTGKVATDSTQPDSILPADPSSETGGWSPTPRFSENLDAWATMAGWTLEWGTAHDYWVTHGVDFRSTFKGAVVKALEYYRTAPVALSATFYGGNSVLVVTPLLARRLQ